ncbi:PLD nuclease N-terminal domain-containing protein [Evansella sp. AB-rgal1]|uniref:PLD nuclease N-terminal domain-containing protein n=1 Tax=Evansella sp. AB-rgal1 TaxID=3242696 RepID=UPI00359E12A8
MEEILQDLQALPWNLLIPIIVIQFILMVVALVDCFKHNNTKGPQWIWVLVIVFVNIFGPIAYFIFGRRNE